MADLNQNEAWDIAGQTLGVEVLGLADETAIVIRTPAELAELLVAITDAARRAVPAQAQPRYIPDAECVQGKCARPTTGCWGECSLKRNAVAFAVPAQASAPAAELMAVAEACVAQGCTAAMEDWLDAQPAQGEIDAFNLELGRAMRANWDAAKRLGIDRIYWRVSEIDAAIAATKQCAEGG